VREGQGLPGGAGAPTEKDPARSVASDLSAGERNALRASFYFAGLPSARLPSFVRASGTRKSRASTQEKDADETSGQRRCRASRSKPPGRTIRERTRRYV